MSRDTEGGAALDEKKSIERATAEAFIFLYNCRMATTFAIVEYSDAPDVRCRDVEGNLLNLEITLTEDRSGDIQSALGRSDARSVEELRKHLADVKAGKANILDRVSCLQGNVVEVLQDRICSKLQKDYGPNTALVVRDASPLGWDWESVVDRLRDSLDLTRNPFDEGIWIVTYSKDRIIQGV